MILIQDELEESAEAAVASEAAVAPTFFFGWGHFLSTQPTTTQTQEVGPRTF